MFYDDVLRYIIKEEGENYQYHDFNEQRNDNTSSYCHVLSLIFKSPSTERNEDVYDILRYSHRDSNHH